MVSKLVRAGFSHGLSVAESSNFADAEWIETARRATKRMHATGVTPVSPPAIDSIAARTLYLLHPPPRTRAHGFCSHMEVRISVHCFGIETMQAFDIEQLAADWEGFKETLSRGQLGDSARKAVVK